VIEPTCSAFPRKRCTLHFTFRVNRQYPLLGKFCHPITREKNRVSLICEVNTSCISYIKGIEIMGAQAPKVIGLLNEKIPVQT